MNAKLFSSAFHLHQVMYKLKVLGKFCGQKNSVEGHHPGNEPILSPGNHLDVIFQTDDSNPGPHQNIGFSAFYQAIGTVCYEGQGGCLGSRL